MSLGSERRTISTTLLLPKEIINSALLNFDTGAQVLYWLCEAKNYFMKLK